jgi:HSP20 family protein
MRPRDMNASIDETIERVEQLYFALTGTRPPNIDGAPMPPETDPVRHVEDQMSKLFAAAEKLAPTTSAAAWSPPVCAWHDEAGVYLAIDVPGVTRESLELELDGRRLVVRGTRVAPWPTAARPDGCEVAHGAFTRAFAFAEHVEPEQLSARLEAGVLHVRVARARLGEPARIQILVS